MSTLRKLRRSISTGKSVQICDYCGRLPAIKTDGESKWWCGVVGCEPVARPVPTDGPNE